jgi:hypothetical protein
MWTKTVYFSDANVSLHKQKLFKDLFILLTLHDFTDQYPSNTKTRGL